MSFKYVALCVNAPEIAGGDFCGPAIAKYRGSAWVPYFRFFLKRSGRRLVTAEQAKGREADTVVICEEDNPAGLDLVRSGATPGMVFTFESPLYTPGFYDRIPEMKSIFGKQMLFSGGTHRVRFPSFDWAEVKRITPYDERRNVCLVAANKHYSMLPDKPESPSFRMAVENQLHNARFDALNKLGANVDVYGQGWNTELPNVIGPVNDKLSTLSQYRYSICYENVSHLGYITEKVIDCFVAGTVPIYRGAPDIYDHIPSMAIRAWDQPSDDWQLWLDRVTAARRWLYESGNLYSYSGFAQWVMDILDGKA